MDSIKSRLPGLSTDLLPQRNVWGGIVQRPATMGGMLSAINESTLTNDPATNELLKLRIFPAMLERKIRDVDLTDQQYDRYQQLAGMYSKKMADGVVSADGWHSIPDWARRDVIAKALDRTREQARNVMLMENPALIGETLKAKFAPTMGGR